MKILFTAPRFHTNQAAIVKELTENGHDVRYFVVFIGATEDHSVIKPLVLKPSKTTVREKRRLLKNVDESTVESAIGGHFIPNFKFFKKAFEGFMPDVVICREKTNLTLHAKYMCDKYNIPCVLYDQESVYPLIKKKSAVQAKSNNSFLKRLFLKAESVFNTDKRLLKKMRNASGFPTVHMTPVQYSKLPKELSLSTKAENTYFIPFIAEKQNGIAKRNYFDGQALKILSVGKFRDYKNLKILPDALEILIKSGFNNWSLTIVGQVSNADEKQYLDELLKNFADKGLNEKVKILTNVPFSQMGDIYLANDLFILTSKREVASVAVIEAMSYGLAVVTTDYNGTASYVTDAGGGYVFETENAKNLADKIMLAAPDIKSLGQNAANYVSENLQFGNYYNAMSAMLEKEFNMHMDGECQ